MSDGHEYDAVIVGAGPNGLAAAIELARAGLSVIVLEARATAGGGARSAELTLPGFVHDVCAAVHPMGIGSPFFQSLPLHDYGLEWIQPPIPAAHPFDDGEVAVLDRAIDVTAAMLGPDGAAYRRLIEPIVENWGQLVPGLLGPLGIPKHPWLMGKFGINALKSASRLSARRFRNKRAQALFAGMAAHSNQPLSEPATSAVAMVLLAAGHAVGWPIVKGGSQRLTDALEGYLRSLGGVVLTNHEIRSLDDLPSGRAVLWDITPRQLLHIAGDKLPQKYRDKLIQFRYGPGAFKIDWALAGPIPFTAEPCRTAGTVHLGGTFKEIEESERMVHRGEHSMQPFVLLTQPSRFDPSRVPSARETAWAYCHVPNGSQVDMTDVIESQVERFAPGFRDLILARHTMTAAAYELYNPNYVGGDINGGSAERSQLFARPVSRLSPYRIPVKGWYFCSSSTPPGGGVHGMCGYRAAQQALKDRFPGRHSSEN